jgi:hypothetical protein
MLAIVVQIINGVEDCELSTQTVLIYISIILSVTPPHFFGANFGANKKAAMRKIS